MNSVQQPNQTYYEEENLILDHLYKLNQSFSLQFSDYLKDICTCTKEENNHEEDN